ncbi:exported protein of unknown function [Streptantibioticus cattleyicolor NRRL 8057 = DSM 46488]|nr:exported protein of unknown function [Streptantibioticus cattleyicolor NRRL 8057 = DSM 46488]
MARPRATRNWWHRRFPPGIRSHSVCNILALRASSDGGLCAPRAAERPASLRCPTTPPPPPATGPPTRPTVDVQADPDGPGPGPFTRTNARAPAPPGTTRPHRCDAP